MGIPPPTVPTTASRGATSTTMPPPMGAPSAHAPIPVGQPQAGGDLNHPPGYQQNINAGEMNSNQRAAAQQYGNNSTSGYGQGGGGQGYYGGGEADGESYWDSAMKFAKTAGEKLSAAESEVWKRINKE